MKTTTMTSHAIPITDRAVLEPFLRRDPARHLYSLGDLDPFFWPHTRWFGWVDDGSLAAVLLLYAGMKPPSVLAFSERPDLMRRLVTAVQDALPDVFELHVEEGILDGVSQLGPRTIERHGRHLRMRLRDTDRLDVPGATDTVALTTSDLEDLRALYAAAYPENWFDPRMLETGQYVGVRRHGQLVSVAGVHVYSADYRVAALGNITSHPAHRGQGLARAATASLCRSLSRRVDVIGLNVKADNQAAIHIYEQLGFETILAYEEARVEPVPLATPPWSA